MQRHFSNRGEAVAEVTAARMLARRKARVKLTFGTRTGRQVTPEQWFSRRVQTTARPKRKPPARNGDVTIVL